MRLLLHFVGLLHVPAAVAVGLMADDLAPAAYAGAAFELGSDPIAIAGAVLVGLFAAKWWQVAVSGLIVSAAIHMLAMFTNELATGSVLVFASRLSGVLTIAYAASLLRILTDALSRRRGGAPAVF